MKNTFKTLRKKEKGLYPYIVKRNFQTKAYLFEITKHTSYKTILKIQDAFLNETLLFATTDKSIFDTAKTIDVHNIYNLEGRRHFPFYWYKEGKYYDTIKTKVTTDGHTVDRLKVTDNTVIIESVYDDF